MASFARIICVALSASTALGYAIGDLKQKRFYHWEEKTPDNVFVQDLQRMSRQARWNPVLERVEDFHPLLDAIGPAKRSVPSGFDDGNALSGGLLHRIKLLENSK
ncbi:hypothetical protein AAVH_37229 [Aphelenchoides avenae]|nr:hypothetical protein AAVH_37229 [Aphelenchus avenae]